MLVASALGIATLLGSLVVDKPYCYKFECCREPWISHNITQLKITLETRLCGQLPAKNIIVRALNQHWTDKQPSKPLVLSLHGSPGIGKSFTAQLVRDTIFRKQADSQYFLYINTPQHFPHVDDPEYLHLYRKQLHEMISSTVSRCGQSLIVIEEAHLMSVHLLESIRPFLDSVESVDKVDYRQAIFVFISNSGYKGLVDLAYEYYQKGLSVHDIPVLEFESVIKDLAFKDQDSAFYQNILLARHLIDFYVPFFPMTKEHVRCCVRDRAKKTYGVSVNWQKQDRILRDIAFFPAYDPVFAEGGCKTVKKALALQDWFLD